MCLYDFLEVKCIVSLFFLKKCLKFWIYADDAFSSKICIEYLSYHWVTGHSKISDLKQQHSLFLWIRHLGIVLNAS